MKGLKVRDKPRASSRRDAGRHAMWSLDWILMRGLLRTIVETGLASEESMFSLLTQFC